MGYFRNCSRCGWKSLEFLKTYSYCANCNYNSVEEEPYENTLERLEKIQELFEEKNKIKDLDFKNKKHQEKKAS